MAEDSGQAGATIEVGVTPEMIAAGIAELRDHSYCGDTAYMVESVYRAMRYVVLAAASEIKSSK